MPTPSDRRSWEGLVGQAGMRVIRLQIWIHHSSLQFPGAWSASLFLFCRALPPPFALLTFSLRV